MKPAERALLLELARVIEGILVERGPAADAPRLVLAGLRAAVEREE
jgi:hypothetical protein